jgi:hypothetical protein
MNLLRLQNTPIITIYHDTQHGWLFIEWHGALTLPTVQAGCLAILRCFIQHPHPLVLNSNSLVTAISFDVVPWLVEEFMPCLGLTGVEQLVWISAPTLRGRILVQDVLQRLPPLPVTQFEDLDLAVNWLKQQPWTAPHGTRLAAIQLNLRAFTDALEQKLAAAATAPPAKGQLSSPAGAHGGA